MSNSLRVAGVAAELHWGYHKAATLSGWAVTGSPGAWVLTATIRELDDFKVSQRPLMVVTPNGWRWPVQTLQITDGTLTASLGPKE